jgi:hypothetical protein
LSEEFSRRVGVRGDALPERTHSQTPTNQKNTMPASQCTLA